tara:strand:- start:208 stop:1116 length:909 start_codon:yes stop_codon:yes gene_type:complete
VKKLLGIIILGLLWCNIGFADYYAISKSKTNKTRSAQSASLPTKERAKEVALNMCLSSFGNKETCYIESVNFTEVKVKGGYDIELRAKYDEDLKKLFENSSNYSCRDDIDISVKFDSTKEYLNSTFKNKNKKFIEITNFGLTTKNRQFMIRGNNFILKPFSIEKRPLYTKNLNLNVAYQISFSCKVVDASTTLKKSKNKNHNNWSGVPDSTSLWAWVALGVVFLFLFIFVSSLDKRSTDKKLNKTSTKNTNREKLERKSYSVSVDEDNNDNLMGKIKRLKSLYNNGTLTKAEFEKAKNKLLK